MGSVTTLKSNYIWRFHEFQLTRSVGSVTIQQAIINEYIYISTHTLRGERDIQRYDKRTARHTFSTHTLRGERDFINNFSFITVTISTHTLREERDYELVVFGDLFRISTHTLRGERDAPFGVLFSYKKYFQLTRSVGSVTKRSVGASDCRRDFNSHAPWGSVTTSISEYKTTCKISTHTLRGERDGEHKNNIIEAAFQLTRSVGSVTLHIVYVKSHHHNRADILLKITLKIDIFT